MLYREIIADTILTYFRQGWILNIDSSCLLHNTTQADVMLQYKDNGAVTETLGTKHCTLTEGQTLLHDATDEREIQLSHHKIGKVDLPPTGHLSMNQTTCKVSVRLYAAELRQCVTYCSDIAAAYS